MADDTSTPPPLRVLPDYLPLEIENGNVVIPRDFWAVMSPNKLTDDWAVKSVPLAPFFELSAIDSSTNVVNTNHETGENTLAVRKAWLSKVRKIIFGKKYRDTVRMGWNTGLCNEMPKRTGGERSSWGENDGVDFAFRGKTPTTMEDVTNILFGDEVIKMVKDGHFAAAFGLLFKWGYYLTMEGCTSTWAEVATENYIQTHGFRVVLGNRCVGEKHMSSHGWHRIGRKMATNSFQTTLRRKQEKYWGVKLLTSELIRNKSKENTSVIDLRDYLPLKVIKEMSRKDGTKFKYVTFNAGTITKESVLGQKVGELVHWAKDHDIGEEEVKLVVTSKFADFDMNVGTRDDLESESDDDPVATVVQPAITGAKARDMHPPKQMANQITDQSKIPKMAPRRNVKTNEVGVSENAKRTKTAIQDMLKKSAKVSFAFTCSFACMIITFTNIIDVYRIFASK